MPTTSSLGVGAGVDLQSMLTKLMAAERAPINLLDTKIASANTKISLYGTLNSKLDAFKSAAETLQFPSRLSAMTASSSDSSVLGASAVFTAAAGSYELEVTQLASAQKSVSMGYVAGTSFGGGDLVFVVGGGTAQTITLAAGSYTLEEVSTQINDAKTGVTATVINTTGGGQRLILTSDKSGTANAFTFSSDLVASGGQSSLDVFEDPNPLPPGVKIGTVAKDATMTLDGIAVSSSTNQFTDTVTGLTMTAVKLGTSTVTVQNDSTKITAAVQAFVDTYNAVATTIKTNSGYNASTKSGQAFNGDATARGVLDLLGNTRTTEPTELSSASFKALSELGVTIQQTGLLSLDSAQLAQAISTSSTEVIKTLTAYGKSFADSVASMQSSGGMVSNRVDSLNASVTSFKSNQEALEYRLTLIEKRYRTQFTTLDTFVSKMQTLSGSLTQIFAQK